MNSFQLFLKNVFFQCKIFKQYKDLPILRLTSMPDAFLYAVLKLKVISCDKNKNKFCKFFGA